MKGIRQRRAPRSCRLLNSRVTAGTAAVKASAPRAASRAWRLQPSIHMPGTALRSKPHNEQSVPDTYDGAKADRTAPEVGAMQVLREAGESAAAALTLPAIAVADFEGEKFVAVAEDTATSGHEHDHGV